MAQLTELIILPEPAIQRDGTRYSSKSCIDGESIRFYQGRPQSLGGYKVIDGGTTEIIRNLYSIPRQNVNSETTADIYFGRPSSLSYINFALEPAGLEGTPFDRTPDTFVADVNNVWDFDIITATDTSGVPGLPPVDYLIAHAAPNEDNLNNNIEGIIFYGKIDSNDPLEEIRNTAGDDVPIKCSGGILVIDSFLLAYGNKGIISWCSLGYIQQWEADNFIVLNGGKVIQGMRFKGGGIFWTISCLYFVSYNVALETFASEILSPNITILSPDSVIEYQSTYFWMGNGQFYMYNGVVQKLVNNDNQKFIFDNLNYQQREKIFGVYMDQYSELWWYVPLGNSQECNHLIIYNIDTGRWSDTPMKRSCGLSAGFFPYPLFADSERSGDKSKPPQSGQLIQSYPLWMHEYGINKVMYNEVIAIPSFYETNFMSIKDLNPQSNKQMMIKDFFPDFVQTGPLQVTFKGYAYPKSTPVFDVTYTFTNSDEKVDIEFQGSYVTMRIDCNAANSSFQAGINKIQYQEGDKRPGS